MAEKKITIKNLPKSMVQFEIVLDDTKLEKYKGQALEKLSKKTDLPGFRPGKVPADVIEKHYGNEYIKAYTLDTAFPYIYADIVQSEKLQVIAQPDVKEVKTDPVTLEVTVAVIPEVKIGNYKKIKVPKKEVKVTQKEVDEVIGQIKQRNAEYKIKEGEAKKEDRVEIHFSGEFEKGVKDERLSSKHHPIIIGSNTFIPGFEDELVGLKKGDKKTFDITFPKDYHHKEFQKKKATFEVEIVEVESVNMPEINEEFIKKITGKETKVDEFMKDIEENLKAKMQQDISLQRENELMDKVFHMTTVDLPDVLLKEEIDYMLKDLKARLAQQKMDFDHYLQHIKKTEEELRESFNQEAEKRVSLRLAIQEIIKKEEIEVPEEDIKKHVEGMKMYMPKKEHYKLEKEYKKGKPSYNQLENKMRLDKVIEMLLSQ